MYIGSITPNTELEYIFDDNKVVYKEVSYIKGLIKCFSELIDNSVDVAIKTKFEYANVIEVKFTGTRMTVKDNGTGIPVKKNSEGHYIPEICWNRAKSGSNFDDDENRTQIGMNGVGSYCAACFSTKFIGETHDGTNGYKITIKDGAESFHEQLIAHKKQGTTVIYEPDLERFGLECIDSVHQSIIQQRLINLSMSFPEITFKFNNKKINTGSFKKYIQLFGDDFELYETLDYKFAILSNDCDDFRQFSYVNGLKIPDGGTHIDIIQGSIVKLIREKLIKKYKTIKPGDIKNKLMVVAFLKNVKNTKFNSQSKEKITNSIKEMNAYFGDVPFDKIAQKILKKSSMIDPITEVYRIKEEFKRRQDLKGLQKTSKKIKSDKYYPSIGTKKYLVLVEGDSAFGGLSPVLGRKECGYYILKGKPLNSYSATQTKFTDNKELSELYKIIQNENYQYIIMGTDQDLDGYHIRGLLVGFFDRYLPDHKDKIGILQTPIKTVLKNNKIQRWYYNLSDEMNLKKGETSNYYKGLGTWDSDDLKVIVQSDGIDNMIDMLEFNSAEIIEEWLGKDSAPRKNYIQNNEFNLTTL